MKSLAQHIRIRKRASMRSVGVLLMWALVFSSVATAHEITFSHVDSVGA